MKKIATSITLFVSKFDAETVRMIVLIGTLTLFVLAAGAPGAGGGVGH